MTRKYHLFTFITAFCLISGVGRSQTTQLKSAFCPTTVASMGTNIRCDGVSGAEGYRFEVWSQTLLDSIGTYDSYANNRGNKFRFSWMPGGSIEYSTTYAIRVSWYDEGTSTWSPPGVYCEVTTPGNPITQLSTGFCDSEVATESTNIFCDQVTNAVEYRFQISVGGIFQENVDKSTYKLRLSDMTAVGHPQHCTQYDIIVASRNSASGPWSDFGNSCFVTFKIPTTDISATYCGTTINYLQQDTIHANALGIAEGYRYRLVDGPTTILDTVNNLSSYNGITLRKFPGVQYGTTYDMSVQVLSNGCWGDFGPSCAISTVAQPVTILRPAYCGGNIPSAGSNVYSNSIVYGQEYEFRINGGVLTNEIYNTTTSNNGNSTSGRFRFAWLDNASSVSYGTTYAVECRVKVGGTYGAWGSSCNVTLDGSPVTELKPVFCGVTLPSMGTNMYCNSVSLSQGYKFEVRTTGEVLVGEYDGMAGNTSSKCRISWVPGTTNSTTYRVRAAWHNGTSWSAYGSFCEVTTPAAAMPLIGNNRHNDNQEKIVPLIGNSDVILFPNPFKDVSNIDLSALIPLDLEFVDVSVYNSQGKMVETRKVDLIETTIVDFGREYEKGSYFIHISSGNYSFYKRAIKL